MEKQIKTYKFDSYAHRTVLLLHNYYPNDPISHGPYCVYRQGILKKYIKQAIQQLELNGYVHFDTLGLNN